MCGALFWKTSDGNGARGAPSFFEARLYDVAMQAIDLRIDAAWIVPVEPAGTLTGHALIVDGGKIVAILPAREADAQFAPRERVSLADHVLIPGFVNAHTHSAMTLMRGIADDVPLQPWLTEHIWPREGRFVSPEFVHDGTMLACAEMLRGGVTACNDMYFYPGDAARAYEEAGMRALIGMPILDFPTAYAADARGVPRARPRSARRVEARSPPRVRARAACAVYRRRRDVRRGRRRTRASSTCRSRRISPRRAAKSTTRAPRSGRRTLARLDTLGATGPNFIAIHAVHVDERDIATLVRHRCHVVHCPASNMKLASGIAPVAKLVDAGVNVALGTDGAASNNRLDLLSEMRLASLLAKVVDRRRRRAARAARCSRWRRSTARARWASTTSIGLARPRQGRGHRRDRPRRHRRRSRCSIPCRISSTSPSASDVSDVWVRGRRMVANRSLDRDRRSRDPRAHARSGSTNSST